jgi:hypothetical protein
MYTILQGFLTSSFSLMPLTKCGPPWVTGHVTSAYANWSIPPPCPQHTDLFFFLNCFWWNRSPYCLYFSSAAAQRIAYSKVPSQMAAHHRTAVHCRLGRLLDSNPGLQFYYLVSLPMSHHCSHQWSTTAYWFLPAHFTSLCFYRCLHGPSHGNCLVWPSQFQYWGSWSQFRFLGHLHIHVKYRLVSTHSFQMHKQGAHKWHHGTQFKRVRRTCCKQPHGSDTLATLHFPLSALQK